MISLFLHSFPPQSASSSGCWPILSLSGSCVKPNLLLANGANRCESVSGVRGMADGGSGSIAGFGFDGSLDSSEVIDLAVVSYALAKLREDLWRGPAPAFDVAIGEREVPALRMPAGGEVPPSRRVLGPVPAPRRDAKMRIVDALLVDIDEEDQLRRPRIDDLGLLGEARQVGRLVGVGQAIDRLAQVVAAGALEVQDLACFRSHLPHVGWAPVDVGRFVVMPEQAVLDIVRGGIERCQARAPRQILAEARRRRLRVDVINEPVGQQKAIVVRRIELCTDLKLLEVVQAGQLPAFCSRQRKRRQQNSNQKGENRDDNQQFDQRKSRTTL